MTQKTFEQNVFEAMQITVQATKQDVEEITTDSLREDIVLALMSEHTGNQMIAVSYWLSISAVLTDRGFANEVKDRANLNSFLDDTLNIEGMSEEDLKQTQNDIIARLTEKALEQIQMSAEDEFELVTEEKEESPVIH